LIIKVIKEVLNEPEVAEPEIGLDSAVIKRPKERINNQRTTGCQPPTVK
jgi:hypothetical protein